MYVGSLHNITSAMIETKKNYHFNILPKKQNFTAKTEIHTIFNK